MKNSDIKKIVKKLNLVVLKIDSSRYCSNFTVKKTGSKERQDLHKVKNCLFLKNCNVLRFAKAKFITVRNEEEKEMTFWIYANSSTEDFKQRLKDECMNFFDDIRFVKLEVLRNFNK